MIRTVEDADKDGLRHLNIEKKIALLTMKRETKISRAKEEVKAELAALKKEDDKIMQEMAEFFWRTDERDPETKAQLTLTHVRLTERTITTYKYPSPLQKLIDKARKLSLPQFVRTKEEVDKERIRAEASPDTLKALGVKVSDDSTVYIESLS